MSESDFTDDSDEFEDAVADVHLVQEHLIEEEQLAFAGILAQIQAKTIRIATLRALNEHRQRVEELTIAIAEYEPKQAAAPAAAVTAGTGGAGKKKEKKGGLLSLSIAAAEVNDSPFRWRMQSCVSVFPFPFSLQQPHEGLLALAGGRRHSGGHAGAGAGHRARGTGRGQTCRADGRRR